MSQPHGRRLVVGRTQLPDDLPADAVVARKDCGCYLILSPDDGPVHEFTCEHGYWVGVGE